MDRPRMNVKRLPMRSHISPPTNWKMAPTNEEANIAKPTRLAETPW